MRVLEWFRDRAVRKVVRFGLPAAIGKFLTSISGLVTLSLLTRHLDVDRFGVITEIRFTVGMVEQYANFNTWLAIIKYGTEAIAQSRLEDVKRVIKLAMLVDVTSAVIATVVIASLALAIPGKFSWTDHEAWLCVLYTLTILTRVSGVSDGVFRIYDAYRAQAIVTSVAAVLMTGAVAIAVATDASFDTCVYVLILSEVAGNLLISAVSFRVAAANGNRGWTRVSLRGLPQSFPGIARFLLSTSAQLTVKKTQTDFDMFVVVSTLGKAPAAMFRVVKQLGTIPGRIFMPFEQVLFTEVARYAAAKDYRGFGRLLVRSAGLAVCGSLAVWAVAAVAAAPLIRIVAGSAYLPVVPAFRIYLLAMVLNVANTPVQRAMVALGRPGTLFFFDLATLGVLIAMAFVGAHYAGLVGLSVAVLTHKVIQFIWSTQLVLRIVRHRLAATPTPPASPPGPDR